MSRIGTAGTGMLVDVVCSIAAAFGSSRGSYSPSRETTSSPVACLSVRKRDLSC